MGTERWGAPAGGLCRDASAQLWGIHTSVPPGLGTNGLGLERVGFLGQVVGVNIRPGPTCEYPLGTLLSHTLRQGVDAALA